MKKIKEEQSNGDVVIILMNTIQLCGGGGGGATPPAPAAFFQVAYGQIDIYVSRLLGYLLRDPWVGITKFEIGIKFGVFQYPHW